MKMKRNLILVLSIVALVSALILGTTAVASAATHSQVWYLNETGGAGGFLQMLRGNTATSGTVTIGASHSQVWVANEAALADVTFPSGSWIIYLTTDSNWASTDWAQPNIEMEVGYYNPASGVTTYFTTQTGAKVYLMGGRLIIEAKGVSPSEAVFKDDYLVVKIFNNDTASHSVVCLIGASSLISPNTDPGYPLPEIAAGILLGGGLIGLVGYVAIRRKKVSADR